MLHFAILWSGRTPGTRLDRLVTLIRFCVLYMSRRGGMRGQNMKLEICNVGGRADAETGGFIFLSLINTTFLPIIIPSCQVIKHNFPAASLFLPCTRVLHSNTVNDYNLFNFPCASFRRNLLIYCKNVSLWESLIMFKCNAGIRKCMGTFNCV